MRNRTLIQAAAALGAGRMAEAEPLLTKILEKRPDDPDALNLLAGIRRGNREFEAAERLLARCVALAPGCAGYRFNYASVLRRRDKFHEALAQADAILRSEPDNAAARDLKAMILPFLGRHADTLAIREELVAEYPDSPDAWMQYGQALRRVGRGEECVAAYRRALALAPSSASAYIRLADLKTYRFTTAEIAGMERLLTDSNTQSADRAPLHFALGKAHGEAGQFDKSFEHYAKANAFERAAEPFDTERLTQYRQKCETCFTAEFFRARAGWGDPSSAPVFIVGMPRSGSTLIEQILSSHSAVEGLGELADLDSLVGEMFARTEERAPHEFWIGGWFEFRSALVEALPRIVPRLSQHDICALGQAYVARAARHKTTERPRFSDKGLRNFGHAGLIALALPGAAIIDVRRHPLDCSWSLFKSHFPGRQPFAAKLADIGCHYRNYVQLMDHFDCVLPGRIHRIIYERLVADPEREIRQLLAALGLPFEEQCLQFHENRRPVTTISSEQVRTPLYRSGVAQWQPYEPWLGPLKAALGPILETWSAPAG